MKKLVNLVIVFAMLLSLCSCSISNKPGTTSSQNSSAASGVSSQTDSQSTSSGISNQSVSSSSQVPVLKYYLKTDSTKGTDYNAAIMAYNEFLSGVSNAIDLTNHSQPFNINDFSTFDNQPGIAKFALFDVNGDSTPELITVSQFFEVFSYKDNQVVELYSSINLMDATVSVLTNGAIFTVHPSAGTIYYYTTINKAGVASDITFSFAPEDSGGNSYMYMYNDNVVTKNQYDTLTCKYFVLSNQPAKIVWNSYAT